MDTFRVRLNYIDHYQANPTDLDPDFGIDSKQSFKVPIIRVFGSTETGQKVCAHVHGCLPYLYVDYYGSLEQGSAEVFIQRFRLSIDHALAVSYRRDQDGTKATFVAHISLVKGVPFFGYYVGYRPYLKIYLLNPLHITRLSDLLRQGAVMGRNIQPYESHMQYVPQWMSDYNLYGCAYLDCKHPSFRSPVPSADQIDLDRHKWHNLTIPRDAILDESKFPRQSHCAIEVDICVQDILNRHSVKERRIHHDFGEALQPVEYKEKLVPSMETLWRDESKRRRLKMGLLDPDSSPFEPEVLISVSAEARENSGEWIHEEEYREHVRELAADEMAKAGRTTISYSDFSIDNPQIDHLKTAYESVEDLHPAKLHESMVSFGMGDVMENDAGKSFDVDEVRIRSFGDFSEIDELDIPSNTANPRSSPSKTNGRMLKDGRASGTTTPKEDDLAKMGVRAAGDYTHADEDAFEIPDELIEDIPSTPMRSDRKRALENFFESNKRQKNSSTIEQGDSLKNSSIDAPIGATDSPQTNGDTPKASRFNQSIQKVATQIAGRLSFPGIKSPINPQTLECLSQRSTEHVGGLNGVDKNNLTPKSKFSLGDKSTLSGLATGSLPSDITAEAFASAQSIDESRWTHQFLEGLNISAFCLDARPPLASDVMEDLSSPGSVAQIYKAPHYSDEADVPDRKFQYGGREYFPGSYSVPFLPNFEPWNERLVHLVDQPMRFPNHKSDERIYQQCRWRSKITSWEIDKLPPSRYEVETWLAQTDKNTHDQPKETKKPRHQNFESTQVAGNTQPNNGAKYYHKEEQKTSVQHETQYMSIMSLEIHVNTRRSYVPNPEHDELSAVFWRLQGGSSSQNSHDLERPKAGVIVLSGDGELGHKIRQMTDAEVVEEESELDLFNTIIDTVRDLDPDIISGFEIHDSSWGYMIERARLKFDMNLCDQLSRVKTDSHGRFGRNDDRWGFNQTSTLRITGRHPINIWRAMRGEINLLQYTMENIIFHLFKRRIPHYAFSDLTRWWKGNRTNDLARVVNYLLDRTQYDLDILDQNDLVPRISEQARLLGVDFYSVFSRGSQFKVESLMFRIAKPENFMLVSPSKKQVGSQNALECLPMVMEPHSAFYNSPLLVLDFQSLYPSVMIAYNYCYSTFLGRIVDWRGRNKMGFTEYQRQEQLLELLKDHINIAPNGMMYCKPNIRKSLLAKMLGEILETRVMVKSGMKKDKDDQMLQRLLNNRQLALKFIANVTYGYTSASFSGRMPCSEIADSIVQTGRETLEKAIMLIHSVEKWGAEVVYGDTDSIFVYLKGKTRDQAFTIGREIADSITAVNPKPIKLKFEKVYHPCVLLAKKRYVGFKYEDRRQKEPEFDAKGIETVRRDGTPAEQRIEEKALKLLFRTQDLSEIKRYFQKQCSKIMRGQVSIQDFCYAREVKLGAYSDKGPPPPGALISTRRMLEDPRAEPQYGERVPYVVVTGAPGARLIDRCVAPEELLASPHLELDAEYYITKNLIPPLERIFNLVGGNVRQWYDEMPKFQRVRAVPIGGGPGTGLGTGIGSAVGTRSLMENYMRRTACVICGGKLHKQQQTQQHQQGTNLNSALMANSNRQRHTETAQEKQTCKNCETHSNVSVLTIRTRINKAEKEVSDLEKLCRSCAGLRPDEEVKCDSKACPVFYSRTRHQAALNGTRGLLEPVLKSLEAGLEW